MATTEVSTAPVPMQGVEPNSQIAKIGFDGATNTLAIEFAPRASRGETAGPIYHYANATPELFEEFQKAKNAGDFFYSNIRYEISKYPFVKVRDALTEKAA